MGRATAWAVAVHRGSDGSSNGLGCCCSLLNSDGSHDGCGCRGSLPLVVRLVDRLQCFAVDVSLLLLPRGSTAFAPMTGCRCLAFARRCRSDWLLLRLLVAVVTRDDWLSLVRCCRLCRYRYRSTACGCRSPFAPMTGCRSPFALMTGFRLSLRLVAFAGCDAIVLYNE
jgi:hypothetical protein